MMKKEYSAPVVEVVHFDYSEQVVVASSCVEEWMMSSGTKCTDYYGKND